jgi:hypothetical protein
MTTPYDLLIKHVVAAAKSSGRFGRKAAEACAFRETTNLTIAFGLDELAINTIYKYVFRELRRIRFSRHTSPQSTEELFAWRN